MNYCVKTCVKNGIVTYALVVLSGYSSMSKASEQSESNGFVADSHLVALLRNYFWNLKGDLGHQRDWEQALMVNFRSGFTQGAVGIGVDSFVYANATLDSSSGHIGGPNLQVDGHGNPTDGYAKGGGAIKLRLSNTTLKVGDMETTAPVFTTGYYYQLNQTVSGLMVDSNEINDLTLHAGHFTSGTGRLSTARNGELGMTYAGVNTPEVNYVGGVYSVSPQLSFSLYGARFKDLEDNYYFNANYVYVISDEQSLTTDFNMYRVLDSGQANAGSINVTAASLAMTYAIGAHAFGFAHVRIMGDEPFDYAAIGSTSPGVAAGKPSASIYVANSVELSDFNSPGERSWQLNYGLDMAGYGVPGLSMMAKYIYGSHINGTGVDTSSAYFGFYGANEKEQEVDLSAKYVVQSGSAKDLSFSLVLAKHTGNQSTTGANTLARLIVDYPINFF